MKVLVTGAGGQLGSEVVHVFAARGYEVVGTTHESLDITDAVAVEAALQREQPDWVIHCAAWTAVDACESDAEKAFLVNASATEVIVQAASRVGARVVYISTDYVFDGSKNGPYVESDIVNPQSVYGASKLAGERAMHEEDLVVRVSWLCGFTGSNMVKTILRIAEANPELSFVSDQVGHPTFADDAARKIIELVDGNHCGIFHVTNQGAVSWYEFAQEVLRAADLDPLRVKPVTTAGLLPARPAKRPANSVLANAALTSAGVELLDDFRVPLRRLVKRLSIPL